jgi:taurine transport system ATP-binding protein
MRKSGERVAGRKQGFQRSSGEESNIELLGVGHEFSGGVIALQKVDLSIRQGEFVTVIGPSGCGKTTLMRLIAGFETPTHGQVTVGGEAVTGPDYHRGVVFQSAALYPWMSVQDNVSLGPRMRGVTASEWKQSVEAVLDLVGLSEFATRPPYELSGGMQQRAAIARVLVNDAPIMLMDEPFGALDALTRERLQDELVDLWEKTGKTIILITHSIDEAVYMGGRVLVMSPRPGRLVRIIDAHLCRERDSQLFLETRKEVRELIFGGWGAERVGE